MLSKNVTQHFKDFGNGFTQLHAKLDADKACKFLSYLTVYSLNKVPKFATVVPVSCPLFHDHMENDADIYNI
jgi:hypothetical protein